MSRVAFILTLFLAVLIVLNGYSVKQLVEPMLTIYLIIAGFLIILFHQRAWEFIKPLLLVGLALLLLPPLFHDLIRNLGVPLGFDIGFSWLWNPILIILIIVASVILGVSAGLALRRRLPPRNRGPYLPPGAPSVRRPYRAQKQHDDD